MKKLIGIGLLLGALLLAGQAGAELSTNLKIVTVTNRAAKGKPETETYVDAEGKPVVASDKGYATIRYTYEGKNDRIAKIELLDADGYPVNGNDGYSTVEMEYGASGRQLRERCYYDKDGKPVTGPEGYARYAVTTVAGKYQETWQYDPEGNPVNTHEIILYHDGKKIKSDSWYDAENNLTDGPDGYAWMEAEYVSKAQSKVAYYDAQGNLFYYKKAGYARMERAFERGRETAVRYFGVDNELIPGPDGYAYAIYSYTGTKKRTMYYNADGSLYYTGKGVCGVEQV